MFRSDCCGLMGLLFGHKYQPRFTVRVEENWRPQPLQFTQGIDLTECSPNVNDRQYEGDVCVRCGSVVNEPRSN